MKNAIKKRPYSLSIPRIQTENKLLCFSFQYFDPTQGQSFADWQSSNLLVPLLDKLKEYSKLSIMEAQQNHFTIYSEFPAKSDFKPPKHIPPDVSWASLHIKGKECVIGHVVSNVFYIVFLDKDHRFWITEKKHT